MNILLVGVCDKPESTNTFILNTLRNMGNNVATFNYRTVLKDLNNNIEAMNNALMIKANAMYKDLDFVLFCKTDTILPMSINYINQLAPTFYFFMDPMKTAKGMQAHLLAKECTYASATCDDVVNFFKSNGQPNCHRILEGFDASLYKIDKTAEQPYNTVFIGSATEKRIKYISRLAQEKIPVTIFGNGWPAYLHAYSPIYNEELVTMINASKIILNFTHDNSYSDRVTITLASGGFLLSEYATELEKEYHIGTHLDVFNSQGELARKIQEYLNNAQKRNSIRFAGNKCAQKHTWENSCKEILGVMQCHEL